MTKTQVTIETFKDTGKWYDIINFETDTPAHDTNKIIEECKALAQKGMSFTFEAESPNGGVNKRMVIILPEEDSNYTTILAQVGSLVITPKELKGFKNYGIDLPELLKTIQALLRYFNPSL